MHVQQNITRFMFNNFFGPKSYSLWDNAEKYSTTRQDTDANIIRLIQAACWITKTVDTHSEYVILTAFPLQQMLRERASILLSFVHCRSCLIYGGSQLQPSTRKIPLEFQRT